MKKMLQLSLLAIAILLYFDSDGTVTAQSYNLDGDGYGSAQFLRVGNRSNGVSKKRLRRQRARSRKARRAKRRTAQRIRRRTAQQVRRRTARGYRRGSKRRVLASLGKRVIIKKKRKKSFKTVSKGPVQIVISIPKQRVSIYKGGRIIDSARVSTGRPGNRTPSGVFSIIQKHKQHFSNLYNSAPMPYMQRITWSGIALHAGNVSRPYASHGCIRLPYGFAKKLFRRTRMGAHVIVASSPSSMSSIKHDSLFQPTKAGNLLASAGVQLASNTEGTTPDTAASNLAIGGIPGFVKPVVAAVKRLEDKKKAREDIIAAKPSLELSRDEATKKLEETRLALSEAKKTAIAQNRRLRDPRRALQKVKRQANPRLRVLRRAEKRAKWAHQIIEKRLDNPRYEGKWMTSALARAAQRDETVAAVRERLAEVTQRLDVATADYDAVKNDVQKANDEVAARLVDVREAKAQLYKAGKELSTNKRAIVQAKKAVQSAQRGIKSAKAREKMPLRILVTPRKGRENVKDVQKMLTKLGFNPGVADGAAGPNTRAAIKAFQKKMDVKLTGLVSDKLVDDLYSRLGRTQQSTAHMYVRQGFVDLFDIAVDISEPSKPIGTHVYTAMHFDEGAGFTEWTAITVKNGARKKKWSRKSARGRKAVRSVRITAQQALGRLRIPGTVSRQISMLLTPGSSMVVSDNGISHETGKGTDFVVLTK